MRWVEHVASMGEERRVLGFGEEWMNRATLKGNIMCISQTWWEHAREVVGCCEHGNEHSGYIDIGEFGKEWRDC